MQEGQLRILPEGNDIRMIFQRREIILISRKVTILNTLFVRSDDAQITDYFIFESQINLLYTKYNEVWRIDDTEHKTNNVHIVFKISLNYQFAIFVFL